MARYRCNTEKIENYQYGFYRWVPFLFFFISLFFFFFFSSPPFSLPSSRVDDEFIDLK